MVEISIVFSVVWRVNLDCPSLQVTDNKVGRRFAVSLSDCSFRMKITLTTGPNLFIVELTAFSLTTHHLFSVFARFLVGNKLSSSEILALYKSLTYTASDSESDILAVFKKNHGHNREQEDRTLDRRAIIGGGGGRSTPPPVNVHSPITHTERIDGSLLLLAFQCEL